MGTKNIKVEWARCADCAALTGVDTKTISHLPERTNVRYAVVYGSDAGKQRTLIYNVEDVKRAAKEYKDGTAKKPIAKVERKNDDGMDDMKSKFFTLLDNLKNAERGWFNEYYRKHLESGQLTLNI